MIAGVFIAMAMATLVNMGFIITRPETISVVNSMIGQGVLVIGLLVIARKLFEFGNRRLKPSANSEVS